jgi:RNA polymerase sigma factor (sigma-70 family)
MTEPWDTGITEYEQAELRADLSAALLCLSEKQRWALLLVCYYGYTQEEAAATLGISARALRYRLELATAQMGASLTAEPS